jgi:hypothetical protein
MELRAEVIIGAPARRVWAVLGEQFGDISRWAAPIQASSIDGAPTVGACRTCHIAGFGPFKPGVIKERLIAFAPEPMSFAYRAVEGLPGFVGDAVNRWSVEPLDEHRSVVRVHATVELRGPMRLVGALLRWRMRVAGERTLEELKHHVENGRPHPRKLHAMRRLLP